MLRHDDTPMGHIDAHGPARRVLGDGGGVHLSTDPLTGSQRRGPTPRRTSPPAQFYEHWCQRGFEPAVALNHAQLMLRTATRSDLAALLPDVSPIGEPGELPYADPRYWAAFAYTGA